MSFGTVKKTIQNTLEEFIFQVTDIPKTRIVLDGRNQIRVKGPYVGIRIISIEDFGRGRFLGYDVDGKEITASDYQLQVEIKAYRDDPPNDVFADATCWQLQHALKQKTFLNILSDADIGYSDVTNTVDQSVPLDKIKWEQRFSFIVSLNASVSEVSKDPIPEIDTVNMTSELLDTDDSTIIEDNISVTYP